MRWKSLAASLAICALLLIGTLRLLSHPSTYREVVAAALDAHRAAYRDIQVGEPCQPDPGFCFAHDYRWSYATVAVYQQRPLYGRIECHDYQVDCYLTLPALRIHGAPLQDLAGGRITTRSRAYHRVQQILAARPHSASARPVSAGNDATQTQPSYLPLRLFQPEPVEPVRPERQEVRQLADLWEARLADDLHRRPAIVLA